MPSVRTRGIWHRGPPPSKGWWIASYYRKADKLRWWDGKVWSVPCNPTMTAEEAAKRSEVKALYSFDVEWIVRPSDWPGRSFT